MNESTISIQIRNNLLFLTKKFNISEAELSRKTNLPQATVNRLLNAATEDPRASTLKAVAEFFNVTIDQLLSNKLLQKSTLDTTRLPIYKMEQDTSFFTECTKNMASKLDLLLTKKEERFLEVEPTINNQCIAFEVKGDSMWPQFMEGILVIVDTSLEAKNRDFVIYLLANSNQIVLRQFIDEEQNKILKPINYAYKSIQIEEQDIYIGTVIQAKNDFREKL